MTTRPQMNDTKQVTFQFLGRNDSCGFEKDVVDSGRSKDIRMKFRRSSLGEEFEKENRDFEELEEEVEEERMVEERGGEVEGKCRVEGFEVEGFEEEEELEEAQDAKGFEVKEIRAESQARGEFSTKSHPKSQRQTSSNTKKNLPYYTNSPVPLYKLRPPPNLGLKKIKRGKYKNFIDDRKLRCKTCRQYQNSENCTITSQNSHCYCTNFCIVPSSLRNVAYEVSQPSFELEMKLGRFMKGYRLITEWVREKKPKKVRVGLKMSSNYLIS